MTTRLDIRTAVRIRLEDTTGSPLWDDATLNTLIAGAMRRYGARFPAERALTVAVAGGATNVPVSPALHANQVVRVFDPGGEIVPRVRSLRADGISASGQAWRWWQGGLVLAQGAAAGDWRVEYIDTRTLPADDVTALDVIPGDEEIVVLATVVAALRRRAIEDAKRGVSRSRADYAADAAEREVEAHLAARKRRAIGGFLAE